MARCERCEVRQRYRHGLCAECLKAAPVPVVVCLHCGVRAQARQKRGLCLACYCDKAVRVLYPKKRHSWEREDTTAHMTLAELEAFIAEQLKPENLPPWWADEVEKQKKRKLNRVPGWLPPHFRRDRRHNGRAT